MGAQGLQISIDSCTQERPGTCSCPCLPPPAKGWGVMILHHFSLGHHNWPYHYIVQTMVEILGRQIVGISSTTWYGVWAGICRSRILGYGWGHLAEMGSAVRAC